MYTIKGHCAGMLVLQAKAAEYELPQQLSKIRDDLREGRFTIHFGVGQSCPVTELCVDVFDDSGKFLHNLSTSFKR